MAANITKADNWTTSTGMVLPKKKKKSNPNLMELLELNTNLQLHRGQQNMLNDTQRLHPQKS